MGIDKVLKGVPADVKDALVRELINFLVGLFRRKPKAIPVPEAPVTAPVPGTPAPIQPPSSSTAGERKVARVVLRVQKAEKPDLTNPERPADPGNLYPDPMGMVSRGENFNYGASLWLDLTAFDEQGEEWQGHSLLAADLDFRTKHIVTANDGRIAFIEGRGATGPDPDPWLQQNDGGVSWAFRAWKDSIGFNARARFGQEGVFRAVGYVAGVQSNELTIKIS